MSYLIYCIEPTSEAEDKLVNYLTKLKIQPDIDFFNQLMSKRCTRKNGKKDVMDLFDKISHYGLAPNLMTFGCVAMACTKKYEIFKFLRDMREVGIKPHIQIMGALICNATRGLKKPEVGKINVLSFHKNYFLHWNFDEKCGFIVFFFTSEKNENPLFKSKLQF